MCKLFIVVVALSFIAACNAGKLSTQYLPPQYAASSGGHAGFLLGPGGAGRPANHYLAPQASNLHYHGVAGQGQPRQRPAHTQQFLQQSSHASAASQIPILRSDYNNDGNGNYNFGFDTGNGIHRDEAGQFHGAGPQGEQTVKGSYSYTGDDGQVYTVNYKADGNGFHAEGAHLPTPPPIPAEIQESLALHYQRGPGQGAGHGAGVGAGASGAYNPAAHGSGAYSAGGRGAGVGGAYGSGAYHHAAAASAPAPSANYLPPQHQGYNYGRRH